MLLQQFMLIYFQIYIIGGSYTTQNLNDFVEVFDAKNKTIEKVLDVQNNWVKVPVPYLTEYSTCSCIVPMINENAFAILGGYSV